MSGDESFILGRVNLILFEPAEVAAPLPRSDRRAAHILDVLRRKAGETFDAGVLNGPRGKGTLVAVNPDSLTLAFEWEAPPPPLDPFELIVGLPRPQTARDILREATTLGVSALHFVKTEKGDANYARSTLWSSGEWRRHMIPGAEQAFDTRLPQVTHGRPLAEVLTALPAQGTRIALDNYQAPTSLGQIPSVTYYVTLAVGPERGWSATERDTLRSHGFTLVHLGARVLRTETAIIAAIAIINAKLGRS